MTVRVRGDHLFRRKRPLWSEVEGVVNSGEFSALSIVSRSRISRFQRGEWFFFTRECNAKWAPGTQSHFLH
jgi:hypothetical protein